jgi:hypothetical protein
MRFTSRLRLALLVLAIFGSGMLTSVAVSWVRLRWFCRGLDLSIPPEFQRVIGQSEVLGAIDDFVAVKVWGGDLAEGEDNLYLIQRNGQWLLRVSRDAHDGQLKLLSFDAFLTGSYTVFYDKGPTPRKQALALRTGPGQGIHYVDTNGDGVCEWIHGPRIGFHLYTTKGWVPARQVAKEYWIQFGDTKWYRAEEVGDGTYGPVGEPQAQVPASQPESELQDERPSSSTDQP